MKIITEGNAIIKSRCNNPEQGAIDQAIELSKLPFLHKHVALMPDTHQGYGMPIGGVIATKWVVIPNAVGVDIGCGMCAVKTSLTEISQEDLKNIIGEIRKQIPVGFNHHEEPQDMGELSLSSGLILSENFEKAEYQLGTLGGGNHFIEIQKGDDGYIWIMIHSGSRNVGLQVAKYYNDLAKELNEKRYSDVPKDLNFLPINTKEGKDYLEEMQWCLNFALANRTHMMNKVQNIFIETIGDCKFDDIINIHHNYAALENHYGENVVVHRKGATLAREGTIGIIPGSQGTKSYIVEGLGNKESFMSCSHGAGRKMGRKDAERNLDLEAEQKMLDDQGILHSIRGRKDLDEAPSAYKDIDVVMEEQKDLVKILVELTPLAVVKG